VSVTDYLNKDITKLVSYSSTEPTSGINAKFGLKHITFSNLPYGKNKITFRYYFGDSHNQMAYSYPLKLYIKISPPQVHKKSMTPIIVSLVIIVPLFFIGTGSGVYYCINNKRKKKALEKTDIEKMTINNDD